MSLLQDILTGTKSRPRIITLVGVPGIGKSTWAASAPSPVFIQTEQGLDDIGAARFPLCASYECVIKYLTSLCTEKHEYKTVVIDSLSALEPMVWRETCAKHGKKNIEDFGYGKGYVMVLDEWRELTKALDYLRENKGMNVILIGHSKVSRFNDPEGDGYDQYDIDLDKRAAAMIFRWSDEVFFANYRIFTKTTGEGQRKRTVGIGQGERVFYTEERPGHKAKNRLGLPEVIPITRENGWAEYAKYLK